MSTITAPRKSVKSARPFSCSFVSIVIEINDTRYACDPIAPGECGSKAFRFCKASGAHEVYDVIRTHAGTVECSCPDYIARHQGNGYGTCKHGRALVELGLMPAPIAPEFAAPAPAPIAEAAPVPVVEPAACVCVGCLESRDESAEPCCAPSEPAPCLACTPAPETLPGDLVDAWDAPADPELWDDSTDRDVWMTGPEPVEGPPDAPTFDLAGLVEAQALAYRAWRNDAGAMLADAMDALALKVRMTGATTPAEYDARVDCLETDARESWFDAGVSAGREPSGSAFGHMA